MSRHWTQDLHDEIQNEISLMAEGGKAVFGDIRPQASPQSPKARVNEFLSLPRADRQQLALTMGPDAYRQYVDQILNDAVNILGPGAANLYDYFAQDTPQQPYGITDPAEEIQSMLEDALYSKQ